MVRLQFSMTVVTEVLSNGCHHHLLPLNHPYNISYIMAHMIWVFHITHVIWPMSYGENLLIVDKIDFFLKSLSIWIWVSPFLSLNSAMKILKFRFLMMKVLVYVPEISAHFVAIYNDNKINETDGSNPTGKLI